MVSEAAASLPIAFLRAVFACTHNHVGDVLRVADIAWREQTHLAQRIEARAGLLFKLART